jgi:hypothetical protein
VSIRDFPGSKSSMGKTEQSKVSKGLEEVVQELHKGAMVMGRSVWELRCPVKDDWRQSQ